MTMTWNSNPVVCDSDIICNWKVIYIVDCNCQNTQNAYKNNNKLCNDNIVSRTGDNNIKWVRAVYPSRFDDQSNLHSSTHAGTTVINNMDTWRSGNKQSIHYDQPNNISLMGNFINLIDNFVNDFVFFFQIEMKMSADNSVLIKQ